MSLTAQEVSQSALCFVLVWFFFYFPDAMLCDAMPCHALSCPASDVLVQRWMWLG